MMEINPEQLNQYFKLFALCCAAFGGGWVLSKSLKWIIYIVLFFVLLSAGVFFAESFTDIDTSNIDVRAIWSQLNNLFSIGLKFFLDIFNNGGILVIVAALVGFLVGKR